MVPFSQFGGRLFTTLLQFVQSLLGSVPIPADSPLLENLMDALDFFAKAVLAYLDTPEGQAEWSQIWRYPNPVPEGQPGSVRSEPLPLDLEVERFEQEEFRRQWRKHKEDASS